jgi:hypothetical protein
VVDKCGGHFEPILMREITELVVFIWLHILKNVHHIGCKLKNGKLLSRFEDSPLCVIFMIVIGPFLPCIK